MRPRCRLEPSALTLRKRPPRTLQRSKASPAMNKPGDPQPVKAKAKAAHRFRLAQARRLLACFEESEGRAAANEDEVMKWYAENPDKAPHDEVGKLVPLWEE